MLQRSCVTSFVKININLKDKEPFIDFHQIQNGGHSIMADMMSWGALDSSWPKDFNCTTRLKIEHSVQKLQAEM